MRWGSNLSCRNLQSAGSELFSLSLPKEIFPETKRIQKHKQALEEASRAPSSPPKKQEPWGAAISQTRFCYCCYGHSHCYCYRIPPLLFSNLQIYKTNTLPAPSLWASEASHSSLAGRQGVGFVDL